MLRNRSRSIKKDPNMTASDSFDLLSNNKHTSNSNFTVAGLFLGKGRRSDSDSVMSPTSPLEFVKFTSFGSPFKAKTSCHSNSKLGLSIVDYVGGDNSALGVESSESPYSPTTNGKNVVFGPQVRNKSSTLASRIDDHPLVCTGNIKSPGSSIFEIADALEPGCGSRDIERQHITARTDLSHLLAASYFLSLCYSCCKKLAGEDIYIYRGERAFCSPSCRELYMVNDEGMAESDNTSSNQDPDDQESG